MVGVGRFVFVGIICVGEVCVFLCIFGFIFCLGNCVDLNINIFNCGSCGNGCSFLFFCVNGVFGLLCLFLFIEYIFSMGCSCFNLNMDICNCGSCGNICFFFVGFVGCLCCWNLCYFGIFVRIWFLFCLV